MNIGKRVTDEMKKDGLSQMELDNDIRINNLIEIIANELKSSYIDGDGPEWETKLLVQGENPLLQDDIKKIMKQIFSKNPKLSNESLSKFLKQRNVPNLKFNVLKDVSEKDIVRFDFDFPELDYIKSNLVNGDEKIQKKVYKKVIKPFYKYLKNSNKKNSNKPVEIPKKAIKNMEKIIESNMPNQMNSQAVSEYYIYNILGLGTMELQESLLNQKCLQLYSKSRLANYRDEMDNVKVMVGNQSRENVFETYRGIDEFKSLLSKITAELYMNTISLKDKSPKGIEDILKKGYELYTEKDRKDRTYNTDEDGYRTVNVGFGNRDVLLHKNGDNIKKSMINLTTSIAELIKEEPNISEDEYLKRAGMLHFRYISIHPFRDSNGRTGRNMLNMLLAEKDRFLLINRKDKMDYLNAMNEMRSNIPLKEYLNDLSENPKECEKYEEIYCDKLTGFLKEHTHNFVEDAHQKEEQKSMERWENRNFIKNPDKEEERNEF